MKAYFKVAAFIVLFAACASARDDQEWFNAGVDYKFYENCLLHFDQEVELDNSKLVNEESYLLAGYEFCPYFMLGAGHRITRERRGVHLVTEQRPTLEMRFAAPEFWTLRFDLRSRFECRDKSHAQAYMRYRERFRVRTSWSVTDSGVRDSDLLDATRSQVGVSFRPVPQNEHLSATLFFMVLHGIHNGAQDWAPINIFGFEVAYAF